MRIYIGFLLLMICSQSYTMLRQARPIRPARPAKSARPAPIRHYSEKKHISISHEERITNMVSAIKESSKKESGRAHFINTLEQTLTNQLAREKKIAEKTINYETVHELTDHQEILVEATIKYLNDLQRGKK